MALQTPSPTLYVSNIEPKTKKPELRASLYALFTPYGKVIDIVAKKHAGGRGQAFVVFLDQTSATAALRGLTGEAFYGKPLAITYAKSPSNATLALTDPTKSREAEAVRAAKLVVSRAQGEYEQLEKEREDEEAGRGGAAKRQLEDGTAASGSGTGEPATKRVKVDANGEDDVEEIEMDMDEEDEARDGTALICTNLPPECTEDIIRVLFGQYAGFSKATPLPSSAPVPSSHPTPNPNAKSFRVTFSSSEQATAAVGPNKGYLMQPGWEMGVSVE